MLSRLFRTGLPSPVILACAPTRIVEWLLRKLVREAQYHSGTEWGRVRLARLYSALATVAERKGDKTQAIMFLQQAIVVDPKTPSWFHCELARLYKSVGVYQEAVTHLMKALETLESDASPETRPRIEAELRECSGKASRSSSDSS
jgi:tetratricopeptide (TPR) repeat protein